MLQELHRYIGRFQVDVEHIVASVIRRGG